MDNKLSLERHENEPISELSIGDAVDLLAGIVMENQKIDIRQGDRNWNRDDICRQIRVELSKTPEAKLDVRGQYDTALYTRESIVRALEKFLKQAKPFVSTRNRIPTHATSDEISKTIEFINASSRTQIDQMLQASRLKQNMYQAQRR